MYEKLFVKQLLIVLKLTLFIMWPVTAIAAQLSFSRQLTQPDIVLDLALTIGISVLVGLTSLLILMQREYKEHDKIDRLWLFISSKMMSSIVSGVVMYFLADEFDLSRSATVAAIVLVSFSGTYFLEKFAAAVIDRLIGSKVRA